MEYKFRGKVKETFGRSGQIVEWVYGSLITTTDGSYIFETDNSIEFQEPDYHANGMGCGLEDRNITDRYEAMKYGFDRAVDKMAELFPQFIEVLPETVGMWIDKKGKNGIDIYEGDVVQFRSTDSYEYDPNYDYEKLGDTPILAVMRWSNEACGFRAAIQSRFKVTVSMLEVVGNIHDNPELLNPLADSPAHHRMFDPNTPQVNQDSATNEQATEQANIATENALESAALDTAMDATQDSEEGSTEG